MIDKDKYKTGISGSTSHDIYGTPKSRKVLNVYHATSRVY